MPDLAMPAVLEWLKKSEIGRADQLGEIAEPSAVFDAAIERLGRRLDAALIADPEKLSQQLTLGQARDELRALMAQMGLPRMLRIISWVLNEGLPNGDRVFAALMEPDASGAGQFMHAALAEANRPSLLARIYAPDRLALLMQACNSPEAIQEAA